MRLFFKFNNDIPAQVSKNLFEEIKIGWTSTYNYSCLTFPILVTFAKEATKP